MCIGGSFRQQLLAALSNRIRDALTLLFFHGLPVAEGRLFVRYLVLVALDADGVVRRQAFQLRLDLGVFADLARLKLFQLFLLAGFVGIEGVQAPGCVLKNLLTWVPAASSAIRTEARLASWARSRRCLLLSISATLVMSYLVCGGMMPEAW